MISPPGSSTINAVIHNSLDYNFLAITDHTPDPDPYQWWRTQKADDLFHVKGTFALIYGYERSNGVAGGGHRNVFFLERDWPVLRSDAHYSGARRKQRDNNMAWGSPIWVK